jgi:hypothetical protein
MNLAAIEHSDHMTSPQADEHDVDGWYQATIKELIKVTREQHAERTPSPPWTGPFAGSPESTDTAAENKYTGRWLRPVCPHRPGQTG